MKGRFFRTTPLRSLSGKTILITGASFGIGEQLAYCLAPFAAHLLLVARTEEKLKAVCARVENLGGSAEIFPLDLRDEQALDAFAATLRAREKGIDVFVSNAGKSIRRALFDSLDRFHDYSRTMSLNYYAPVKLCLALIPGLVERSGQIIHVSAANVLLPPVPGWAAYQASKTAFDQWFRAVAPELNARGVATSTAYLPLVRTRMSAPTKFYDKMPAMSPARAARILRKLMVKRKRIYKPLWLPLVEAAAFCLRRPLRFFLAWYAKKYLR